MVSQMLAITWKELQEKLYSPQYLFIFITSLVLILFSLFAATTTYLEELEWAENSQQEMLNDLASNFQPYGVFLRLHRFPQELSIIDTGMSNSVGRSKIVPISTGSGTMSTRNTSLSNSLYSSKPIFALFGDLSITDIVVYIFSLFAILLSYNSISGERENGTLRLICSNSISKSSVIAGKIAGGFTSLALAYLIPLLLGVFLVISMTRVEFSGEVLAKFGLVTLTHLLLLLIFFLIGTFSSALSRSSTVSFLIAFSIWVTLVFVIPNTALELATVVSPPATPEEVAFQKYLSKREVTRNADSKFNDHVNSLKLTEEEYRAQQDDIWRELYPDIQGLITSEANKLDDEFRRQQNVHADTFEMFSRVSPVSIAVITTQLITDTGFQMVDDFEGAVRNFRPAFKEKAIKISAELAARMDEYQKNKVNIESYIDGGGFHRFRLTGNTSAKPPQISPGALPLFNGVQTSFSDALSKTVLDLGILLIEAMLLFAASFVAFIRYDIR
jgi:ABC-type transport system involved in multi-copper enzyme maturation permease subunit